MILSNPDMLHVGVLPHHDRWGDVLANLRYVVVDEAHVYRGVFGSHVANVLRRLRRLARIYGAEPQFLLASATISNPGELGRGAARRAGDGRSATTPRRAPSGRSCSGTRRSSTRSSACAARRSPRRRSSRPALVERGLRTLTFAKSRKAAELIHRFTAERLGDDSRLSPYRAGYTPAQRREIERRLAEGDLLGVSATNALELGIDVGLLDAVISVGFPGTVASLRQQWGRAGRRGHGLAVLVASEDALDQYFMREPEKLLGRRVEAAILDHANPRVLAGHVRAAAYEAPLDEADADVLGAGGARARAAADPELRATPRGIVWAGRDYPAARVALRSADAGRVHGRRRLDRRRARPRRALARVLDRARGRGLPPPRRVVPRARARRARRCARSSSRSAATGTRRRRRRRMTDDRRARCASERRLGLELAFGEIEVTEQVVGYERKTIRSQERIELVPLELPPTTFATEAVWFLPGAAAARGLDEMPTLLGTLHAAEHALIALLPLWAMCDRWDIGGLSTNVHPQTGRPTVFVYDGHAGGVGIAERGFEQFEGWVADTARAARRLPVHDGLPVVRAEPEVRQPERAARQGRRAAHSCERLVDFGRSRSSSRRRRPKGGAT